MNTERKLYQWDTGQKLVGCTGLYVDFPIGDEVYRVETADGICIIPDELLQTSGSHKVYECMTNNTIRSFAFSVTPRPKPPDYVYTPTERLTFEGLVQKVDDAVADMIRRAESGEFDGHTPVKGTDYFTTAEIQQIQNEVSSGAIGEFKSVVGTETETFNNNAETKLTAYNQNDSQKTTAYNTNAESKLNAYNANADNRVAEFDAHTEQIQTDISELKSDLDDIEKDFNKFLVPNNRNLLNPIYVKSDKYLNGDGIAIDNSNGWGVSGFVEVESGKIYSTNFQLTQCFYYDSNKNKIAKVNGTEITFNEKYTTDIVPINAKYIRFSMYPSNPHYLNGTMMMIEGSGTVAYVPFERTLKTVNDEKDEIESIIGNRKVLNWEDGKLLVNGVVGTSDMFALAMVDVYPNEKIIVKTGLDGTATVTLFDSDGGIIKNYTSSDGESADGSNIIRKLTISVPSNAKTIGVSCFKNALSTSDAYVGSFDIYNTVMNKQSETEAVEDLYYFACGDSITHANHSGISTISDDDKYCPIGGSEGFTDYKKKGYPYYIAKKNNLKWFNYGIGGSTITNISVNGITYHPFSEPNGRYTQLDDSVIPDYISIFFGWNDGYWGRYAQAEKWLKDTYGSTIYYPLSTSLIGTTHADGTPYATQSQYDACNSYTETIDDKSYTGLKLFSIKHIGNINSYDITTWYGAWNTVLEYMIKKYPYAKIMPVVPYTPEWYGAEVVTKELREAVRLVSKKWGLAYFDFYSTEHQSLFPTPTQFTDSEYLAKYRVDNLLADGLHPNTNGYKYIANMIGSKLMSI